MECNVIFSECLWVSMMILGAFSWRDSSWQCHCYWCYVLFTASSLTQIKNSLTEINWTTLVMPDLNFSYFNGSALNMTKSGFIPMSFMLQIFIFLEGVRREQMISTQSSQIQNLTKRSLLWDISMIKLHKSFINQAYIGLFRKKSHMFSKAYSEESIFTTAV